MSNGAMCPAFIQKVAMHEGPQSTLNYIKPTMQSRLIVSDLLCGNNDLNSAGKLRKWPNSLDPNLSPSQVVKKGTSAQKPTAQSDQEGSGLLASETMMETSLLPEDNRVSPLRSDPRGHR